MTNKEAIEILEELKDDLNEHISFFEEEGPSVTGKYIDGIEAIDIAIDAIKKSQE